MKKVLKFAGLALVLMTAGMGSALADVKIGVVDMAKVFQSLPQREKVSAQLKREFEPRANELRKLENDGQALIEKYKRDETIMTKEQKKQSQEKLAKLQMEFNQKRQAFEQDNARRQGEERDKLLKVVRAVIDQIARDEGYDLIQNAGANEYVSSKLDITSQVIAKASK